MSLLPVLPILIPLLTATLGLAAWRRRRAQRGLSLAGAAAHFLSTLALLAAVMREDILVVQLGSWPAPFGIVLVADLLGAAMVAVTGLMGLAVGIYSLTSVDVRREAFGYHPLYHILLMGCCGAFLTGDLFNLFVWFEVMLIASFVLMALGGEKPQLEGAIKYVTLNLLSSALFLAAVGLTYGVAGTLNMAHLSVRFDEGLDGAMVTTIAMLFLVSFGVKAAVFPLFFWLPASYHTPPVAVSAIFAGLLTKVGVYALFRVFTLLFRQDVEFTHQLILAIAALTMLTGVLGAAAQNEFRRILSFHIVSQIGYMIMGLGLYTPLALAGGVFYIVHHIIVKTNLFLVSGVTYRIQGSFELKKLGGFYKAYPMLGVLFLVPAFSLGGVPPLSGFFAKLSLIRAGLEVEEYLVVGVALVVGLLTLFSMTKIWGEVFWKSAPEGAELPAPDRHEGLVPLILPIVVLALITLTIGLAAEPFFQYSIRTAEQLLDPSQYVHAVLGQEP